MSSEEHDNQRVVVDWLEARYWLVCAIPNAAKRGVRLASYLKAEGLRAGAPDLVVFEAPDGAEFKATVIEMKSKTGRMTEKQKAWRDRLADAGWLHIEAHSAGEAIDALTEAGY